MKYEKTAIRDVINEFENHSRETLIEEISKMRKMINNFSFNIQNAITDIQRPGSDCSIALDHLVNSLDSAIHTNDSKYFNISKFKEQKAFLTELPKDGDGVILHNQDRIYTKSKRTQRDYGTLVENTDFPNDGRWFIEYDEDESKILTPVEDFSKVFKA